MEIRHCAGISRTAAGIEPAHRGRDHAPSGWTGGPLRIAQRPSVTNSGPRKVPSIFIRTEVWKVKSNSSSVLRAGKRAALILLSPPWDSREATSADPLVAEHVAWAVARLGGEEPEEKHDDR